MSGTLSGAAVRQGILINLWRSFLKWVRGKFASLFGNKTPA